MATFVRYHSDVTLAVFLFLLYLALWFVKKRELFKKTGIDAEVIFRSTDPVQKYFGALEKIMTVSIVLILAAHYFLPRNLFFTARLFGDLNFFIKIAGFLTGIAGLTVCRIAQVTMGRSWRVGIDEKTKPGLVTKGIFSLIRNPTYTGLYLLCAGVFVILPTVLLSYWVMAFFIMMEFQVRCEEAYLRKVYGKAFERYAEKTKRYIPFLY